MKKSAQAIRVAVPALLLALLLAMAAAAPACKKNAKNKKSAQAAAEKAKKAAPPKDAIATLKKPREYISLREVNTAWDKELPDQNKFALKNNKENWRQQFLDQWIDVSILASLARREGLDKSEEFKTEIAVKEKSLLGGMYYRDYVLPELEKVTVDDADVEAFYEENKDEYYFTGWREVRHIIVDSAEVASQLAEELKQNPDGFAQAARTHSTDEETAKSGGLLGKVFKGDARVPPEVEDLYLFTPVGQVAGPAQSAQGWHIVLVTGASPQDMDYAPLTDDLKGRIKQMARIKKMEEKYDRILAEYKNEMDLSVDNALVPDIAADWEREMEQVMPQFQQPPMQ